MRSDSSKENNAGSLLRSSASGSGLRWRPWPCPKCSGGITQIGQLFRGGGTGAVISEANPETIAEIQTSILKEWCASCEHTTDSLISFPQLAEGSEHVVFLDAQTGTVFKTTQLNTFGESYYLDSTGRVNQKNCSPLEYLIRLRLWKKLFGSAPHDLGIANSGQIVSTQKFISGTLPTQESVDEFLIQAGLNDVKRKCWLWKKSYPNFEIWLGDARADNFVDNQAGIVPIDIRLWFSHNTPSEEYSRAELPVFRGML